MGGSELELSILEAAQMGEETLLPPDSDQQANQQEHPSIDKVSTHTYITPLEFGFLCYMAIFKGTGFKQVLECHDYKPG